MKNNTSTQIIEINYSVPLALELNDPRLIRVTNPELLSKGWVYFLPPQEIPEEYGLLI